MLEDSSFCVAEADVADATDELLLPSKLGGSFAAPLVPWFELPGSKSDKSARFLSMRLRPTWSLAWLLYTSA